MSNVGKWDRWYATLGGEARPYADTKTYRLGAEWLCECSLVEDRGCGGGWARQFFDPARYRGVDGSQTEFADVIADLRTYRATVPGIFMRHVIEHDWHWAEILDNAFADFTERMVLILFTPCGPETCEIDYEDPPGVPDISFRGEDIIDRLPPDVKWSRHTTGTDSKYGQETIYRLHR